MSCPSWTALTRAAVLLLLPATVAAQVDYRNLDDERPVTTEDAYPVDRYALEIMMPFSFQSDRASSTYLVSTEIESGLFDNGMAGLKLPVGALSSSREQSPYVQVRPSSSSVQKCPTKGGTVGHPAGGSTQYQAPIEPSQLPAAHLLHPQ